MRSLIFLLTLALAPARAQRNAEPPSLDEEAPPLPDEAPEATLDLGRANFESIVEAFVARRSANAGYWPLRDKKTGRLRHLKLVSVDAKRVRGAGRGRFSGPVLLRDEINRDALDAEFVVDMSGTEWKVVGMRLVGPAKKRAGKD
jgi:hypothetical protein